MSEEKEKNAPERRTCLFVRVLSCGCRFFRRSGHVLFKFLVLPLVLILAAADFCCECFGLPDSLQQEILRAICDADDVQIAPDACVQVGVVRGIVVHGCHRVVSTPAGSVRVSVDKASLRLDRGELLRGRILPRRFSIENGAIRLLGENSTAGMNVSEVSLTCELEENDNLAVNGSCTSEGLEIVLHAMLSRGREGIEKLLSMPAAGEVAEDEQLQAFLAKVYPHWQRLLPQGNESMMRIEVSGPLDAPEKWNYKGYLNVSDAYLRRMSALQCSCTFSGGIRRMVISNLHLMLLGHADNLNGEITLYPLSQEAEMRADGVVSRQAMSDICELFAPTESEALEWQNTLQQSVPWENLRFHVDLARSPLSLAGIRGKVRLVLPETSCWDAFRARGEMNVTMSDGIVALEKCALTIDDDETMNLRGSWDIGKNVVSAHLDGAFELKRIQALQDAEELHGLLGLSSSPCEVSLDLAPSELDVEKMSVSGQIRQRGLTLFGIDCSETVIPFVVSRGTAVVTGGHVRRRSNGAKMLEFDLRCPLAEAFRTGRLTCGIESLKLSGTLTGQENEALNIHGAVHWNQPDGTFSLGVEGDTYVETFYQEYFRRFCNDITGMLAHIDCQEGCPMHFTLEIPEVSPAHPEHFQVTGAISFGKVDFRGVKLERASCEKFTVTADCCDFTGIRGRTAANDDVQFNLHVNFYPLEMTFSQCDLKGDPRAVGAFLVDKAVEDVYLSVFKDITWSETSRPSLQMPRLVFYNEETWRVNSDGIYLNAQDMTYRNLKIDEANIIVMLDLPSAVVVEPVTVIKGDSWVSGKVEVDLVGVKQCRFQVFPTQGGLDAIEVLGGLWPESKDVLKDVEISKDCLLAFQGSLFLTGQSRLRLDGSVGASSISYCGCTMSDADLDWSYDSDDVHWNLKSGKVFGGTVSMSGAYNVRHRRGQTLLRVSRLSLDELRQLSPSPGKSSYQGRLSGEVNLSFLKNWAGRALHLDGAGHFRMTDCDLWQMPALSSLEQLLRSATGGYLSAGVGRISEAEADLQFSGQRMTVTRVQTNGTIIALNGSGSYTWTDDGKDGEIHFIVNGTPVKDVKLLSFLLSPVSYLFQAELRGTSRASHWKMKSLLDLIF